MITLSKQLRILSASLLFMLGAGVATQAHAGAFQVTPSGDGLSNIGGSFTADAMNGTSSTLIQAIGGNVYQSSGYIVFSDFAYNSQPINSQITGVNSVYGLYATFSQTFNCPTALAPGVSCLGGLVSLNLWANPTDNDVFQAASLTGPAPTTGQVSADDILLGSVNTVFTGTGGIDGLGGAFENVNTNFSLTAAGSDFFTSPVPFYNVSFNEFNNTSTGMDCNPSFSKCAVNFETGTTNFTFTTVPEPASLAVFGLGLLGLATLRRKLHQ